LEESEFNVNKTLNRPLLLTLSSVIVTFLCFGFLQTASCSLLDDLFGSGYKTYENSTYTVKVDYPNDWRLLHSQIDKDVQPETIFSVMFLPPFESGTMNLGPSVSIDIDTPNPSPTLEEYKDRIMKNLEEATEDVKSISLTSTQLDGDQAYRIENDIWLLDHWERSISIYSVKNGIVNEISALGEPEEIEKNSATIETMFKSVKFH